MNLCMGFLSSANDFPLHYVISALDTLSLLKIHQTECLCLFVLLQSWSIVSYVVFFLCISILHKLMLCWFYDPGMYSIVQQNTLPWDCKSIFLFHFDLQPKNWGYNVWAALWRLLFYLTSLYVGKCQQNFVIFIS